MSHGKGSTIWDVDGNQYLDFAAGIAVLATGHAHPRVVEAVTRQIQKYGHIGATDFFCPQQIALAERLQQITPIQNAADPSDKLVYFGNSGTEAVEAALKLARYQGRQYVIGFYGSFHGRSMGSLSVTASKYVQRAHYTHIPGGVEHVPYPGKHYTERAKQDSYDWGDTVQYIEDFVLKRKLPAQEVAAVLVEPIQGEGGYMTPRDDFFPKLRAMCDRHGILLIVDEIQSGIGRTGKWWGVEHYGVEPDIVCTAKGLGSGLPIGGIIAHRDVMGKWVPGAHASTFGGNPVACAAALATLDVIEEDGLLVHAASLGAYGLERLSAFKAAHPSIQRVDGRGLMIGIEFTGPNGEPLAKFRDEIVDLCYANGLITLAAGTSTLRIAPPLVIRRDEFEMGLDIIERAISEIEEAHWDQLAHRGQA
ncbi:MAG: aminotransferase class III-fold pyridoxal phosphate-dependent enzyme [Chloroflexi bacterium]|nr:aminotransferase class III-fold pyridoxal phosphate-dependent enzyme [Chloroflexota bacterium]